MKPLALFLILAIAALASPDGSYFVSGPATPNIPFQRAIVAYKDGVQKMVIDNTVTSSEDQISWVLPVPAKPIELTPAANGAMLFLEAEANCSPKMEGRGPKTSWVAVIAACLPFLLIGVLAPFRYRGADDAWRKFLSESFIALCWALFASIFFRNLFVQYLGVASGIGGMTVESRDVGNYRVDILKGDSAAPVIEWLRRNGTPLPERAKPIVEDYARQGWFFLAAKLKAGKLREVPPHPIVVSFKTPTPVYPMRLTGLVSSPVVLDLFVVAEGTANVPGWICGSAVRAR